MTRIPAFLYVSLGFGNNNFRKFRPSLFFLIFRDFKKTLLSTFFMIFEMFNSKKQEKREKKWRPEFLKIHISETKADLRRSRNTCVMDFDKLSFYRGLIAIWISWLRPKTWFFYLFIIFPNKNLNKNSSRKSVIFYIQLTVCQRKMYGMIWNF